MFLPKLLASESVYLFPRWVRTFLGVNIINPFCYVAFPSASGFQCLFGSVYDSVHLGQMESSIQRENVRWGSEIETRSSLHHHLPRITAIELGSRRKQESLLNDDVHCCVLPLFWNSREHFCLMEFNEDLFESEGWKTSFLCLIKTQVHPNHPEYRISIKISSIFNCALIMMRHRRLAAQIHVAASHYNLLEFYAQNSLKHKNKIFQLNPKRISTNIECLILPCLLPSCKVQRL